MMEKTWLDDEKIDHEVVYVDQNQEEAQKIVDKTEQMGVPVTEISFENGKTEFVVGFNKPILAQILKA